ncbi:hypothetical protein [Streptomyces sp. JB150]|uniref:hypothetical protein n=1 Tax=Streptomyces sp. JB150 TaxID=2714844 RepID=UPI001409142E|nr:hypothetical protein [Streptomyces sp. JB150]QIJ61403.1 hypothetical protein G7Z13_04660 [Streptomyces sp. JB150]
MRLTYTDADIAAKAVQLGLIQDGDDLPRQMRGRVVAALLQEQAASESGASPEPQLAKEIVVQPGGAIVVDGEPFPWLVAKQPMEITLHPDGLSTVRLTLIAEAVQIIKPEPREEPR